MKEIFKYWHRKGFIEKLDEVLFFLEFVLETQDVNEEGLTRMLDESDLKGGEIMETFVQRLREEGRVEGRVEGREEEKLNIAKELVRNGVDIRIISSTTGLSLEQIEKLASTVN